jgi:hypothetical protein
VLIGLYIIAQVVIALLKGAVALAALAWGAVFEAWHECKDGKFHDLT